MSREIGNMIVNKEQLRFLESSYSMLAVEFILGEIDFDDQPVEVVKNSLLIFINRIKEGDITDVEEVIELLTIYKKTKLPLGKLITNDVVFEILTYPNRSFDDKSFHFKNYFIQQD